MTIPVLNLTCDKTPERLGEDLERAVAAHGFSVLGVHDLGAKLREKGQSFEGTCRVYEVCNAKQAARVLAERPDVSTALPCRISVYADAGGAAHVATIRPSSLLGVFDAPQLKEIGDEVEATLTAILRDAC